MRFPVLLAAVLFFALHLHFSGVLNQVITGDEVHAVRVAIGKPFREIFTFYSATDNSIPMTLYARALIRTVGLSEVGLRLPIMIADVLLLLAPLLLIRQVGRAVAATTMALIAASPLVIYYAIVARPYTPAALLTFLALIAWDRWMHSRKRLVLWAFVLCSSGAVFLHLLCILPVSVLLAWSGAAALAKRLERREFLRLALLTAAAILVLMGPGLPGLLEHRLGKVGEHEDYGTTIAQSYQVLVGFVPAAGWALPLLFGVGSWRLGRRSPRFGRATILLVLVHVASVIALKPYGSAGVVARYVYLVWPMVMLVVACGVEAVVLAAATLLSRVSAGRPSGARLEFATVASGLALAVALPLTSPIRLFDSGTASFRTSKSMLLPMPATGGATPVVQAILDEAEAGDSIVLFPEASGATVSVYHRQGLTRMRAHQASTRGALWRDRAVHFRNETPYAQTDELRTTGAKFLIAYRARCTPEQLLALEAQLGAPVRADDQDLLFLLRRE